MPSIESSVAALIESPDEALHENLHCPNVECRHTDGYNSTASLGHVSNSLAHMLVTLHSSLREASSDPLVTELTELFTNNGCYCQSLWHHSKHSHASLRGRFRWLHLPCQRCQNSLRRLPLVPGRFFGSAA